MTTKMKKAFPENHAPDKLIGGFVPSFLKRDDSAEWYDRPTTMTTFRKHSPGISPAIQNGPIGLVLSGGGAKGAYQAGVWKAIVESGISDRIRVISGTSVGAINAVAIATIRDPERIRELWHNEVGNIVTPNFAALSFDKMLFAMCQLALGRQFPFGGILDRKALESILRRCVPRDWPTDAPDVYATALELTEQTFEGFNYHTSRLTRFWLNAERNSEIRLCKILASCAIPWCFDAVEIGDRRFIDGGWNSIGGDNLPVRPILRRHPDIKTMIAVCCNSADMEPGVVSIPKNSKTEVMEIRPKTPLKGLFADTIEALGAENVGNNILSWSGLLAFHPDFADSMFDRGYQDGCETLMGSVLGSFSTKNLISGKKSSSV